MISPVLSFLGKGSKKIKNKKWEFSHSGSGPPPPPQKWEKIFFFICYMVSKKHFGAKKFFLPLVFGVGAPKIRDPSPNLGVGTPNIGDPSPNNYSVIILAQNY